METPHDRVPDRELVRRELTYELGVLDYCYSALLDGWGLGAESNLPLGTLTALLESFLVHVRVLDEFLGAGATRSDDLRAKQLAAAWDRPGFLEPEIRTAINKQLTHLTDPRADRPLWDVNRLAGEAGRCFLAWFDTLDDETADILRPTVESATRIVDRSSQESWHRLNLGFRWETN
ncbi:hypothetical protein [Agromyces sp. NPDC058104]|uniref:hypothetical protein n=1 Tax=Agromyces sp. NPDC058104 TaxID=3346342 RepID=UPI0036DE4B2D